MTSSFRHDPLLSTRSRATKIPRDGGRKYYPWSGPPGYNQTNSVRHANDCSNVVRSAFFLVVFLPSAAVNLNIHSQPRPFIESGGLEAQPQEVAIHLTRLQVDASPISFGLPLAKDVLFDATRVGVVSALTGAQIMGTGTNVRCTRALSL